MSSINRLEIGSITLQEQRLPQHSLRHSLRHRHHEGLRRDSASCCRRPPGSGSLHFQPTDRQRCLHRWRVRNQQTYQQSHLTYLFRYAYTRKNSNSYNPSFPSELMNSNDLRCNKGATAGSTATYTVKAGDKIGFKLFNNEKIEHPGPGFVYVSKAPASGVKGYDGSGDWASSIYLLLKLSSH